MSTQKPTIAIIAPSGYSPDAERDERGALHLQEHGWNIKNRVNPHDRYQRFSAPDAVRLAHIYAAAEDPEVDVVLALRGGYGLSRLLPQLDFARLAASGKKFAGFSDFTVFQLGLLAQTGTVSFASPLLTDDFDVEPCCEFSFDHFTRCLTQPDYRVDVAAADCPEIAGNPSLEAHGTLWGGNLTMLTHLIGSPYMPQIDGGILFIEDVNENPYRVERMLLQLHYSGILKRQKALILGNFTNYKSTPYDNGYDFEAMLTFIRGHVALPILKGLPFGHYVKKVTLPIGAQVALSSTPAHLSLRFFDYPQLTCAPFLD